MFKKTAALKLTANYRTGYLVWLCMFNHLDTAVVIEGGIILMVSFTVQFRCMVFTLIFWKPVDPS